MQAPEEHKAMMEEAQRREREFQTQRFDALAQYVASFGLTMGRPAPPELFAPPPYPQPPYVSSTSLTKRLYCACRTSCCSYVMGCLHAIDIYVSRPSCRWDVVDGHRAVSFLAGFGNPRYRGGAAEFFMCLGLDYKFITSSVNFWLY